MKKWFFLLFCLPFLVANANDIRFNHIGVQQGTQLWSCYHEPCVVMKVLSFRQLQQSLKQSVIELRVLGGEAQNEQSPIQWNQHPHSIFITCSIQRPLVEFAGQGHEVVPLNPDVPIPGVMVSTVELYLKACHNFEGIIEEAITHYGYRVVEG